MVRDTTNGGSPAYKETLPATGSLTGGTLEWTTDTNTGSATVCYSF